MFYLNNSWLKVLWEEIKKPYMKNIEAFLDKELSLKKTIYPSKKKIFNALNITNFEDIKIVIIWQDPYHQKWQANGLSFSVSSGINTPPSLKNIFKEINVDLWLSIIKLWDLTPWSKQGVLLLNSILTVEEWKPASHNKIWWQELTDKIIETISNRHNSIIFLLWWKTAQKKEELIDPLKHYILKTSHPSPFSVYKWFLWSRCFSKTNDILKKIWKIPINW